MILSLTSVPMETSQTTNGLIQVLFSVTLNKEIVQTFFPQFPQQKLNKNNYKILLLQKHQPIVILYNKGSLL